METTITVWYKNEWLQVFQGFADKFGLKDNQQIETEEQFFFILHQNISYGVMMMQLIAPLKHQQN